MSVTSAIIGTWLHSYEEDTGDAEVFRPISFAFPPSRGRPGVDFRSDGGYAEIGSGADDRSARSAGGRWRDLGAGRIEISFVDGRQAPAVRRILSCENGVLKIAK